MTKQELATFELTVHVALVLIFIEVGTFLNIRKAISMAVCGVIILDRKMQ